MVVIMGKFLHRNEVVRDVVIRAARFGLSLVGTMMMRYLAFVAVVMMLLLFLLLVFTQFLWVVRRNFLQEGKGVLGIVGVNTA